MTNQPGDLDTYLQQVKERCEKATPGPWIYHDWRERIRSQHDRYLDLPICWTADSSDAEEWQMNDIKQSEPDLRYNGEFIAHARTDIPELLRIISALREKLNET